MKKMNKKGFTLIELLAVIVILGLLMAIAIPSVTKYINQSRKKTVVNTIGNYVQALVADVNNAEYQFDDPENIYAVPVECVAIEKGGSKTPWGEWKYVDSDNNNEPEQYAYVLVQPTNVDGDSYIYGFAFKDSKGYGMSPLASNLIKDNGEDIDTGTGINLSLNNSGFTGTTLVPLKAVTKAEVDADKEAVENSGSEATITLGKDSCLIVQ